ncbi:hypothetical protein ERO13_D10G205801v2 [Gossypium hirsutum]|nr:hypothetical protein ERO13_D10G205801v2 [Gossypium hirsutum]
MATAASCSSFTILHLASSPPLISALLISLFPAIMVVGVTRDGLILTLLCLCSSRSLSTVPILSPFLSNEHSYRFWKAIIHIE